MTDSATARTQLADELGGALPALERMSDAQCAEVLGLLRGAPSRERAALRADVTASTAPLPRVTRGLLRAVLAGRRR